MVRQIADWREQPVDHKVWPLVDALNQTRKVQTIASCEGHFWRTSDPYVYFRCSPTAAEALAGTLDTIRWSGALHHYWSLQGVFDTNHRLAFTLRAEGLSHERGLLTTFWQYVLRRRRIDDDLVVLARRLPQALEHVDQAGDLTRVQHPTNQRDEHETHKQQTEPIAPLRFPKRVLGAASRAWSLVIRGKIGSTNAALTKSRHKLKPFGYRSYALIAKHGRRRKC